MAEWSESYVQANDLTIHYHRTGGGNNKPVIMLLHGVMDNGMGWIPVARDLQGQFDVIMTDARGHGQTGGSLEDFSYTLLADDVVAFIRALILEDPHEVLSRIECPILLVTGDPQAHAIVTPQVAQEASRLWQRGEVIQISGAGHCVHRDRYAETMPHIQVFLSRV